MVLKRQWKTLGIFVLAVVAFLSITSLSSPSGNKETQSTPETSQPASPEELWAALLQREPYPYTIPLLSQPSTLDGTYVKQAKKTGEIVHCRRCPDWAPETGIWKLQLSKGTYRIFHAMTGWKSIGTFVVADDRILFANDPCCTKGIGVYSWKLEEGQLILTVIDDQCSISLRAMNLTELPWLSCQPPSIEAAVTDHWPKPPGCE